MGEQAGPEVSESWVNKVELAIAIALQISIFLVTVGAFVEAQWLVAFNGALVLILSFAPAIIERRLRVPLPVELTLITCVFLYASFALGEVRDFYEKIWWWDLALHGLSALTVGIIGFLSIYVFYMTRRIRVAAGWIATITFALAVSVGTIWEIFEFSMDWYFGFNMQKSGLTDTMTDLAINAAGAAIAAAIGYFYVYGEDSLLGHRLIQAMARHKNRKEARQSSE
ncbi:MAG: hypothetical protein O3A13_05135 [Proteobacteria bacterium]|nr:hypothetical protein [Pseudomonadota bacterium]MDA0992997.1 hypothetical protein [Pseudomonadota bacterium]